jgi:hypothetical protein
MKAVKDHGGCGKTLLSQKTTGARDESPARTEKQRFERMKTIILNGSPRKNWNTAQVLKSAQKGAESVGAETEYIDLYDLSYTGCRSCMACKRKGAIRCH